MNRIAKILIPVFSILSLLSCSDDPEEPIRQQPEPIDWPGELTMDLIWCDGTKWIEARPISKKGLSWDDAPNLMGYVFVEYQFKETLINGTKYLRVEVKNPYDTLTLVPTNDFLRRDGYKIYGLEMSSGKEIVYQDFQTWYDGGTLNFNYLYVAEGVDLQIVAPYFYRLTYDPTLPYTLRGDSNDPEYIRYIGLVNHGLSDYDSVSREGYRGNTYYFMSKTIMLEITSGKTSEVVFRHPKYNEIKSNDVSFAWEYFKDWFL